MAYLGTSSSIYDPTRTIASPKDADRFSGNGSTTSFTLSRSVQKAVDLDVYVENVSQEPLTAFDASGTSLTFTGAPPSGTNNIYVVYRNFDSGAQVTVPDGSITYAKLANNIRLFTTDNLTPNGNNTVFTLTEPPADANTVMVTVDGVVQRAPVHYTTTGSTITFTSSPPAGANVHVRHLGFRTTTTLTQLAANSTISQPIIASPTITGGTFDTVTRIGVGVASNTSYGIINRYFGNSEIATQYGTGIISGVGAYSTNGGVFIDNGTSKVYPMLWDASGRVTKSLQPSFFAYGYSASAGYFNNDYIGNVVNFNVGSHYSTSTKRFTAPVTGTYFFTGGALKYNTNTSWTAALINGSTTPLYGYSYAEGASGNESITYSAVIQLTAGDYVKFYANGAVNSFYDGGNAQYHWFSGYLLG